MKAHSWPVFGMLVISGVFTSGAAEAQSHCTQLRNYIDVARRDIEQKRRNHVRTTEEVLNLNNAVNAYNRSCTGNAVPSSGGYGGSSDPAIIGAILQGLLPLLDSMNQNQQEEPENLRDRLPAETPVDKGGETKRSPGKACASITRQVTAEGNVTYGCNPKVTLSEKPIQKGGATSQSPIEECGDATLHVSAKAEVINGSGECHSKVNFYLTNNLSVRVICTYALQRIDGTWDEGMSGVGAGKETGGTRGGKWICNGTGRYRYYCAAQPNSRADYSCRMPNLK